MPFLRLTKSLLLTALCFGISLYTHGQNFQTKKYDREYNPYFKFNKFNRGTKQDILKSQLDKLEEVPKTEWQYKDSLKFAEISLQTGNLELCTHYYEALLERGHDDHDLMHHFLIATYMTEDYKTGEHIVNEHLHAPRVYSEDYFFERIFAAKDSLSHNDSVPKYVLGIWSDHLVKLKKGSKAYYSRIIEPLKNARAVLEYYVMYIHEDDAIIARCFNEMGYILEHTVSLNQAYIAYSIARTYNKKDSEVLDNFKRIKAKHVKKNYNTPHFRKYFPRIEFWRFDYEILKEKIIIEKNDTIPKFAPNLVGETHQIKTPFPKDMIFPVGILLIILLIIFFLKSSKSR